MTTKKKISLAMGLLLASTALQAEEVVNRGIDLSVVTGGVAVPTGTTLNGAERNVMFGDRGYQIPENVEVGSYYATWGIYDGRKYWPADVPVERLSEVYIAFAAICGSNPGANNGGASLEKFCENSQDPKYTEAGSYYLPEIKSLDQGEVSFIDDPWGMFDMKDPSAEATAANTQIKQIIDWKNRNADLDVIMSVGGWSYSRPFFEMISTPENRTKFLNSLEMWLKTPVYGFIDGIDFDFEFPGGEGYDQDVGDPTVDGANYNALIFEARAMIDRINDETGRDLKLTMAIGIGPSKLDNWAQSALISEIMPIVDRMGVMTYDFSGSWQTETWFNSALGRPEGSGQPASIITAIEQLKSQHGITKQDFSKISIGVAFYGRGQANVTHATPENLPGSPASGGTEGGTVEPSVWSYFDLRDNFIGADGRGINGWKVYNYPEYAASLLYNQDTGEAISFTAPEDMQAIANYVKENGFKGIFSWEIDDDNGELLETIHQTLGHSQANARVADKPYIYAPDCVTMAPTNISPGLVFSDAGNVYVGSGWPAACPNQGASWEQNSWNLIGSTDEFTVLGAWETNDDGGTGDGGAGDGGTGDGGAGDGGAGDGGTGDGGAGDGGTGDGGAGDGGTGDGGAGDGGTGDSNAWVPGQVYATAGTEVSHNGRTWTNGWWTNGEPGIDPAWTITSAINNGDAWIPGHAYETAGAEVSHNGKLYRNQWWTNGEPGIDAAWVEISGTSDAPETPVDTPDEGDGTPELPSGGDTPTTPSDDAWQPGTVYAAAGTVVSHNGKLYRNQWWTNGEPGVDAAWLDITPADPGVTPQWEAGKTYPTGGAQVIHNGVTYRSKWWTNGEPGVDPAWERLGN